MDTAQWPQDIGLVKPMEDLVTSSSAPINNARPQPPLMERRARPQKEQALNCPRCNSTNTKFCYYNNYSLTQPRYFCKTCRRYWTEGGSLRNVPVGGGSRKNKRSSSTPASSSSASASTAAAASPSTSISLPTISSSASSSSSKKLIITDQNPKFQEGQDLNLAFPLPEFGDHHHFPSIETGSSACTNNTTTNPISSASGAISAMELLRSTGIQGRVLNPFMPMMPIPEYPSGFGVQDFRSNSLSFSLDGISGGGGGGASDQGYGGLQESSGRLLFPFEEASEARQVSSSGGGADQFEQSRGQSGGDPPGFWNGMMGGGGGGSW